MIAGHLYWTRSLKGPVASKRPAGYMRTSDEAEPLATHPLTADEYALTIATLAGMYPAPAGKHWRDILEVTNSASRDAIEANYRRLAKDRHPDRGGSSDQMAELNNARETALREIGA